MIAWLTLLACGPSLDEPASVVMDREVCDHCGMMVSDARYVAQASTREGDRFVFDDPACAFRYIADHGPHLAHVWFQDSTVTEQAWLELRQVAFVPARGTPMDGGFAAVPLGTEGALSFSETSSVLLSASAGKPR